MSRNLRTLGPALLVLAALSALTASTAQAGPKYSVCEEVTAGIGKFTDNGCKKAGAGNFEKFLGSLTETRTVEAAARNSYILESVLGIKIKCTAQRLEAGATIMGGNPGTSSETIMLENCVLEGNGAPCEIAGKTIKTEPLTNKLAKEKATNNKGEKLLVLFKPTTGAVFAKIELIGAGCTPLAAGKYTVETKAGQGIAGEAWEEKEKPVLLKENEPLGLTGFINFPATKQTIVFVENSAGVVEEVKLKLTIFGSNITKLTGTEAIKVKNKAGTANVNWAVLN